MMIPVQSEKESGNRTTEGEIANESYVQKRFGHVWYDRNTPLSVQQQPFFFLTTHAKADAR
jgi:hypothetical protein